MQRPRVDGPSGSRKFLPFFDSAPSFDIRQFLDIPELSYLASISCQTFEASSAPFWSVFSHDFFQAPQTRIATQSPIFDRFGAQREVEGRIKAKGLLKCRSIDTFSRGNKQSFFSRGVEKNFDLHYSQTRPPKHVLHPSPLQMRSYRSPTHLFQHLSFP